MRIVAMIGIALVVVSLVAFEGIVNDSSGGMAAGLFASAAIYDLSMGFIAYLAPLWIALSRAHPEAKEIGAINILLGWTVIGWLLAMVWALSKLPELRPTATDRSVHPYG